MNTAAPIHARTRDPITIRLGRFSTRISARSLVVTSLTALSALGVAAFSLTIGSADLGLSDVVSALTGEASERTRRVILEWRMPRAVFALLAGAALAIGGAVFQSITRNPLGSPDIIGFSTGAYTGALLVTIFAAGSAFAIAFGALTGGILTGAAVYLLAYRRGVTGVRIIIVGIGVSLFLGAINTWILTRLRLEQAVSAASWGAGSLGEIAWVHVLAATIGLIIALPAILMLEADMRMLEMGDDAGTALGVRAETVRVTMLLLGVVIVALVTAAAGPIAFVALAAPQLALRATGSAGVRVLPAAAMGALLLTSSDLIARTVIAPAQLPVGVVTLCLGGAYLVWLLSRQGRKVRI